MQQYEFKSIRDGVFTCKTDVFEGKMYIIYLKVIPPFAFLLIFFYGEFLSKTWIICYCENAYLLLVA